MVILDQALPAHLVPCWWIGWWLWRAGCISQDTNLLYVVTVLYFTDLSKVCAVHLQQCIVLALSRNGNGLIGFLGLRECKHATFDAPAPEHIKDVRQPNAL